MSNQEFEVLKSEDFDSMYKLMENSFPPLERRTYENQLKLLSEKYYKLSGIKDDIGNVTAFLASWEFEEFNFIEHFAVDSKMRGGGIGTKILRYYLNKSNKPVYLEVELPNTELAVRRIEFYKRLGFSLNEYDYLQPPLENGYDLLPLKVMSYPKEVNEEKFKLFRNSIYTNVYKTEIKF